jgi:hypothetical protein
MNTAGGTADEPRPAAAALLLLLLWHPARTILTTMMTMMLRVKLQIAINAKVFVISPHVTVFLSHSTAVRVQPYNISCEMFFLAPPYPP